jgi:hypothetical protein
MVKQEDWKDDEPEPLESIPRLCVGTREELFMTILNAKDLSLNEIHSL